jgi:hypothetical protein
VRELNLIASQTMIETKYLVVIGSCNIIIIITNIIIYIMHHHNELGYV